jgi:hypothetical protein
MALYRHFWQWAVPKWTRGSIRSDAWNQGASADDDDIVEGFDRLTTSTCVRLSVREQAVSLTAPCGN